MPIEKPPPFSIMKKALIIRYGAYGDIIHMSHLPRLLRENGFAEVHVETNYKGYQLLCHNPFITKIEGIAPEILFKDRPQMVAKHWLVKGEGYDKVINLVNSLESGLLAMEYENVYYMSSAVRRARYENINYYDQTTFVAGFPDLAGKYHGEVFYTPREHELVEKWMAEYAGRFSILINLSGTGPHKRFVQAQEFAELCLSTFEDAHIITTGSPECPELDLPAARCTHIGKRKPFREALLIAKHCSAVVGCESGLLVGAAMWKVPTVMLMTAASIESHCKYNPNDFSLQSPAACSPCHKGPYEYRGCPHRAGNPLCVYFDINKVLNQVGAIYDQRTANASV